MNKKRLIIGIVGVLVVAGGIWFFTGKTSKGGIRLETAKVGRSSISNTVTATGTVEPVTEVEVGTQVSGIIDKLYADYNELSARIDAITDPVASLIMRLKYINGYSWTMIKRTLPYYSQSSLYDYHKKGLEELE